jgi:hypothetical protein
MLIPQNAIDQLRAVQAIITSPSAPMGFNMESFHCELDDEEDASNFCITDRSPAKHSCGTAMCIGGWLIELSRTNPYRRSTDTVFNVLQMQNTPERWGAFYRLFYAEDRENHDIPLRELTSEQASRAIDQFIATDGERAWATIQ